MLAVLFFIARSYRTEARKCPTCGRELGPYQAICPVCSSAETRHTKPIQIPADGTQEIIEDETPVPMELLEKKHVTEEILSKTFVLTETPMLVIRKGKNLGQSFSLNRPFPVSIGRSRVNEIRLDDISVSGQHCRIVPENGRHVLCDLDSTNGTFLNDKKINRVTLKEGDTIRVGETQFLYKIEQHRT
jgi:FHA domain